MREWPSIVPGTPEDYYIVVNDYGKFGTAFAETELDRANYETTIADLMAGQHCDPLRVVMFNPDTNRAEDVSHAIAQEILRRLGLEGRSVPTVLEDFIDCHVGKDLQLTLSSKSLASGLIDRARGVIRSSNKIFAQAHCLSVYGLDRALQPLGDLRDGCRRPQADKFASGQQETGVR
jgi:hypothetical protein